MRTDEQKKACRINGAKSKGPTTPEGKSKSAANANRHNLSGDRFMLLSTENPEAYVQHVEEYVARFQPLDTVERDLVDRLIAASWRDKRVDDMEASLFELEMMRQEHEVNAEFTSVEACTRQTLALLGTSDKRDALGTLLRYQSAARRSYTAAFRALRELQGDRFDRNPQAAAPVQTPARPSNEPQAPQTAERQQPAAEQPAVAATINPKIIRFVRRNPVNMILQNEPELPIAVGYQGGVRALAARQNE